MKFDSQQKQNIIVISKIYGLLMTELALVGLFFNAVLEQPDRWKVENDLEYTETSAQAEERERLYNKFRNCDYNRDTKSVECETFRDSEIRKVDIFSCFNGSVSSITYDRDYYGADDIINTHEYRDENSMQKSREVCEYMGATIDF